MKYTFFYLLALATLVSCSQQQGCRDSGALNFDPSAEEDGTCRYTQVIFYAGSNRIGGTADRVEKIQIYLKVITEESLIGTITDLGEEYPVPEGCTPTANSVVYEFNTGGQTSTFTTRYYFVGGANEAGDTYEFTANSEKDCYVENLTL